MSNPACPSGPNHTIPAPTRIDKIPVEIFQKIPLMTLASTVRSLSLQMAATCRPWTNWKRIFAWNLSICLSVSPKTSRMRRFMELAQKYISSIKGTAKVDGRAVQMETPEFPRYVSGLHITDTLILTSLYLETVLFGRYKGPYWAKYQSHILANPLTSRSFDFLYEHQDSPVARTCLALLKVSPNFRFLICQYGLDDTFGTTLEEFAQEHNGFAVDHNLESLEIITLKNSAAVVERLRLPSLVYEDGVETAARTIFDLIRRSAPPLTYLQLRSGSVEEVALVNVLRLLPMLENIHLSGLTVLTQFLRALDVKNEGSTPPPALNEDKSLTCSNLRTLRLR
ncbi:hypothetical protein ACEPAG_6953 [Sanghuangporus baumii]